MNDNGSSREPLPGLAVYNPALLKKEDLIAQFVARRPLLNRLVEELRRCGGKGDCQHQLIVGARGSGKTTLLRRLRYAIEDDSELSSRWVPLAFPEEQYNVSRLSDLWVNCLDALSDMLERCGREDEAESLDQQIDKLPADDEKRRAQAALDLLIGWAKKEDRGLILLFDNSDLIFDRLKDDHWAIREVLSTDNHLLFIGATIAPIEATYSHEGAFYDFFKIHETRGLTDNETLDVLLNLARLRQTAHVVDLLERDPGRLRSLNLLTGGNLRTIVVLYQLLARGSDDSIRHDLEQLLDQYTPLYKHRFEALSAQSQQVVDALALNWDPATAADLAEKLRLETNAVSAVLNRLAYDGVVEKAPSPPGEKMFFQIAERFFNIWYLMRASRRARRKLVWLVEFLKMFYGAVGLLRRARLLVQERPVRERDRSHRAELALAYAEAVEESDLRRALVNEGIRCLMSSDGASCQGIKALFDLEGDDALLKPVVERFQTLRELSEQIERARGTLPAEVWDHLIAAPSLSLVEKMRKANEIACLGLNECKPLIEQFTVEAKQLTEEFGTEPCRELFEAIRSGDMVDAADVEGADAAAIKWNDASLKVIARLNRFDQAKDRTLLEEIETFLPAIQSPQLWLGWVRKLADSESDRDKISFAYEHLIKLDGHTALTWHRIGKLLTKSLKRFDEAASAYRRSVEIDPDFSRSWNNLGNLLSEQLNKFEEAEAAYRRAIELDPKFAWPWNGLGNLFNGHFKKYDEAEAAYRKAIELDPGFAWTWNNLGSLLQDHLERHKESESAYRKAIELDPKFVWPWRNLGNLFHYTMKQRFDEAESMYRKAIELDPSYADTWHDLGSLLSYKLNRPEEAEQAYRKAVELDERNAEYLNSLAWQRYLLNIALDEAELHSRCSVELEPTNVYNTHTLACILIRRGKWDEAVVFARQFIVEGNDEYHEKNWLHTISFFRDAIATSRTEEAVALLDETEYDERWRPLREALQAIAEDDSSYLLRVAPEIRQPAEEIVAMLLPEGVRLGSAPKPARARRTRRKRSLS